jgi:phosphoribosylamine--glycine ligase
LKIVFVDNRLALDHALRLAKEGHDVYYFHEWRYRYGRAEDLIGIGLHDRLIVVPEIWDYVDDADLVVIADVGYGGLGGYLRGLGLPVFGGNEFGDSLENSRLYAASVMDSIGVKHPEYHEAIGVEQLMDLAERLDYDFFLKVDMLRGNMETARITSREKLLAVLNDAKFGPFQSNMRFICSEPVEGVELGVDAWFNGREFIYPTHWGNEIKGTGCCFGKWVEESVWDDVLDRFENVLRGRYWGTISFEAIYDGEELYVLDVTSRFAKPAGALQYFSVDDYGDLLLSAAAGDDVELRPKAKYTAQISLDFPDTEKWWCLGQLPDNIVVAEYAQGIGGKVWVYNRSETGNLVHYLGIGDDLDGLLREVDLEAFRAAENLGLGYSSDGVKRFILLRERLKEYGIDF